MRTRFLLALLLAAAPARALEAGRQAMAFHGGLALPGGALDDKSGLGFSVGGSYRQQLNARFSGLFEGEFFRFGDHHPTADTTTGADAFALDVALRADFPAGGGQSRTRLPFVLAGGGLTRVSHRADSPTAKEDVADWRAGLLIGAGTELSINSQTSVGFSARLRTLGTDGWALSGGIELSFSLAPLKPIAK